MTLQHLRSSTANKRPLPGSMSDGQIAINTNTSSPGLFFKDSAGALVKVGPVHVGSTAPNASPASGGTAGNSVGEQWLDTSSSRYVFKIWDGSAWRSEAGEFVDVAGDVMTGALGIIAGSASSPGLYFSGDTNTGIYSPGADQVAISTGGFGRLHITSGGSVGINTSSVVNVGTSIVPLEIKGAATDRSGALVLSTSDNSQQAWQYFAANVYFTGTSTNHPVIFLQNNTERMRLDSSGRLGLGTSSVGTRFHIAGETDPTIRINTSENSDTWSTTSRYGTIQFYSQDYEYGGGGEMAAISAGVVSNFGNGPSLRFSVSAPSGGAANPAERMRLTQTGLGIGTQTPSSLLEIQGSADGTTLFTLGCSSGAGNGGITNALKSTCFNNNFWANLRYDATAHIWNVNATERARIDSSGRLLVGTSSTSGNITNQDKLAVVTTGTDSQGGISVTNYGGDANTLGPNACLRLQRSRGSTDGTFTAFNSAAWALGRIEFNGSNGSGFGVGATIEGISDSAAWGVGDHPARLVFSTTADGASSPTERMRIASNGKTTIKGSTSDSSAYSLEVTESGGIVQFTIRNDGVILTGTDTLSPYNNTTASAANLFVTSGGELQRSTSSIKYKRNVEDSVHGLTELLQLRPVTYQSKADSDGEARYGGLIAEEVDAVGLSEFVQYAEDGSPDALAYGNMVSLCIKAIQEQQAVIEELQAKIAALEGN